VSARYLTLAQASERVSTPSETIRYWIHLGRLKGFKPGRQVLVRESDLDELIEASAVDVQRIARARGRVRLRAVGGGP
jgi:excisionase family DNA binding protein